MKTNIKVSYIIKEYGSYVENGDRKCEIESSPEDTFRNALKILPKKILNTWERISFIQNGFEYIVSKCWLRETNYDFNNSVLINKIEQ